MDTEYSPEQVLKCLYNRPYRCPCCDAEFTERTVRMSEIERVSEDSDFRPYSKPIDTVLYDIVICRDCGYASYVKTFENLSFIKSQIIRSEISSRYKNISFPQIFSEEIAVSRYKAALLCAMLTREKTSEIAILYMRLAWVYRAMGDAENEKLMMIAACEGFLEAVRKEYFPIIDMDLETTLYVMGDFMLRLNKNNNARLYFDKVIESKNASENLKKRAKEHSF